MYWNMMGQYDSPQIENLLQREDLQISELLDEDSIINELIHRNEKLIQYLAKEDTLKAMLDYITKDCGYQEFSMDNMDEFKTKQLRFKRAHQVTELLNADNETISKALIKSEELTSQLLDMLQCEKDLNPLLACFFSKIIGSLMKQHPEDTWTLLKNRDNFVDDIMRHMSTSGISDLIMRLVVCPSYNDQVRSEIINWMVDEELVEKLINLINLDEGVHRDLHTYATNTINELISILRNENTEAARCPLLNRLTQKSTIEKVIAQMLVEPINSAIVASTGSILSTYLEKVQRITPFAAWIDDPGQESDKYYPSAAPCVDTLANHVSRLKEILRNPPPEPAVALPHCRLEKPLGRVRLQIIRLISEAIPQNVQPFFNALKDEKLLDIILSLFIEHDNNSFLSGYVRDMIIHLLDADYYTSDLFQHLIKDCRILERLTKAWEDSVEEELQGQPRRGYMGHLFQILRVLFDLLDDETDEEPKSKYQEERQQQIKDHLATNDITEEERKRWDDVKQCIKDRKNLYARELGRSQRASSPPTVDPSANSEDQLARYQQKINTPFEYEDNFDDDNIRQENLSDDDDEDKEASFESQLRDKNDTRDWFGTDDSNKVVDNMIMDTNQDPWGEPAEDKENADFGSPGFADFGNFDTPSFANFDSPANTSNTSNTSVEETDFCPPSCSSPSAEEMEKYTDKEEVKEEEENEVKMECESAPKPDEDSHDPAPDSGEHSEPNTEEVKTVDVKTEAGEEATPAEGDKISTDAKPEPSPTSEPQTIPKDEKPATPPPTSGATSSD
ncbi:Oidioi.mRNA.OKI2018_I69.XSR.g15941.t2.cds [Oikopleura dioica]|uniref:Oidioi.mRNA.OKI2018_I69.XSR.g15941.t2.cds n=1 Tax=Oikopleura dioica TaxID=34765 RepID=A0ABN7SIP4_OIKDI|nr:Oidioi.mRNA.OKI2018_I69.XSR.g15941.t2.cds [Oikopleura dioica]